MTRDRLSELLRGFEKATIGVIGDFFLDKYLIIDPSLAELSLETGLEAFQIVEKRPSPGAAGTVCSNLAALRVGRLLAIGAVGDDGDGYELRQGLAERRVDHTHLLSLKERYTPTYTKPMVIDAGHPGGEREINRMDVKWRQPTTPEMERAILAELDACLDELDALIIADQVQERNQGVITDAVRAGLAERAAARPGTVFFVDSRTHIGEFRQVIIKPNSHEAAAAVGLETTHDLEDLARGARSLMERTGRPVFVTAGERGIVVVDEGGMTHVPGVPVAGPIDIVGAGDSTTAGIVSALCAGASLTEAALVGNLVASITIQQLGTTGMATPEQVLERLEAVGP